MSAKEELHVWKSINATKSLDELEQVLSDLGDIEISGDRGAYDMASRLKQVRAGAEPNLLTRNFGIRQQYFHLKYYEDSHHE